MPIPAYKYIPFGFFGFSNSVTFNLLCALHCTIHAHIFLPLIVCNRSLSCCASIRFNEPTLVHVLHELQAFKNKFVLFKVHSILFFGPINFGVELSEPVHSRSDWCTHFRHNMPQDCLCSTTSE